jgi:hypothetical protein
MLKKICGLFLGLVVLIGSACVTPTHASSAVPVIITHIQAGVSGAAREEIVVVYNQGATTIDVTGWCLTNKISVAFFCFENEEQPAVYTLPAYSYAVIFSEEYLLSHELPVEAGGAYKSLNQSSGSIVGSADTISLVDGQGEVIDEMSWQASLPAGRAWSRLLLGAQPDVYAMTGDILDWSVIAGYQPPAHGVLTQTLPVDPLAPEPPDEPDIPVVSLPYPVLTEVFPNPEGSDTGKEFIELFNPHTELSIDLSSISLLVGQTLEKAVPFPAGIVLLPGEYRIFTTSDMPFSLLNSASSLQIVKDGEPVGSVVSYASPKEGKSWALVGEEWQYVTPSPNILNAADTIHEADDADSISLPKPCAANQYRHAETNRCRLIATSEGTPAPCKEGQYRSLDTGRCRTIVTANEPAPCKQGQERNPETNRCRNIVGMTSPGQGVKGVESQSQGVNWYFWGAIGLILLAIIAYAVWEWRDELVKLWRLVRSRFPVGKR